MLTANVRSLLVPRIKRTALELNQETTVQSHRTPRYALNMSKTGRVELNKAIGFVESLSMKSAKAMLTIRSTLNHAPTSKVLRQSQGFIVLFSIMWKQNKNSPEQDDGRGSGGIMLSIANRCSFLI